MTPSISTLAAAGAERAGRLGVFNVIERIMRIAH